MDTNTLRYWRVGNPGERCLGDSLLAPHEVHAVLLHLRGSCRLIGELMYATGLRLEELLGLRVRDVERAGGELLIRDSRGEVARTLRLAPRLGAALAEHFTSIRRQFEDDLAADRGGAALPPDLEILYPLAGQRWCWQFLFASACLARDVQTGRRVREQLDTASVHRAFAEAGRAAGVAKMVQTHSLRHAYAARLLSQGVPLARLRRLMGHANLSTTEQYVEVLRAAMSGNASRARGGAETLALPERRTVPAPGAMAPHRWGALAASCAM